MPGYLFTYKKFKKNYEIPIAREHDEEILKKLKMIIEPFVLRRTKKEVLKELPDKTTIVLNNEMQEEQERIGEEESLVVKLARSRRRGR